MRRTYLYLISFLAILFMIVAPIFASDAPINADNAGLLSLLETIDTPSAVYSVDWSSDSSSVVYGLENGAIMQNRILPSPADLPDIPTAHTDAVTDVEFATDASWIFSVSMDGTVRVWESETGDSRIARGLSSSIGDPFLLSVATNPVRGGEIAYSGEDSTVLQRIWDIAVAPGPPALNGHSNFVFDVEYSPDGELLATGGADGTVRIWEASSGIVLRTDNTSHVERVYDVAFSRDGVNVVSTGQDRRIMMRPANSPGEPFIVAEIPDPTGDTVVNAIDFGIEGDIVVVGDSNGVLRIYRLPTPSDIESRLVFQTDTHDDQIRDLAISPDGTMIAVAGFDRTLEIWHIDVPVLTTPPALPATSVPVPTTGDYCPGAPLSRLSIGMNVRVTFTDGTPLLVRTNPGESIVTSISEGTEFSVIGGPLCLDGYTWWEIELADGTIGWSAEGDSEDYYIEPLSSVSSGASISGIVWHDICDNAGSSPEFCITQSDGSLIADGVLSVTEPVIADVTVEIGNGSCPMTAVSQTVTASDGIYQFMGLEAGTYCISIDPGFAGNSMILIPGEWTYPEFFDPTSGVAYHTVTLSANMALTNMDFGWDYQYLP